MCSSRFSSSKKENDWRRNVQSVEYVAESRQEIRRNEKVEINECCCGKGICAGMFRFCSPTVRVGVQSPSSRPRVFDAAAADDDDDDNVGSCEDAPLPREPLADESVRELLSTAKRELPDASEASRFRITTQSLGRGAFGEVFLAIDRAAGGAETGDETNRVAIKEMRINERNSLGFLLLEHALVGKQSAVCWCTVLTLTDGRGCSIRNVVVIRTLFE